jgi:chromate transporter
MRVARHRFAEVFLIFLRLGCTSFGGPIAHLGYFENEFVRRRQWCSAATYTELVALAQTLPGPASSQVGFALGLLRAGIPGGLAAFIGFTLPSALLMFGFAFGATHASFNSPATTRALHGLMLVAVAVVAQAVVAMQRSLAPDPRRIAIAVIAATIALFVPGPFATLTVIAFGALAGLLLPRSPDATTEPATTVPISRRTATVSLALAATLFLITSLHFASCPAATQPSTPCIASALYRSGALVFGGGHVVLPLLESTLVTPGWVSQPAFLSGYGAAQAMPGPLFSFAAYLGAVAQPSQPITASIAALLGLFAPGLLLMLAALPFWASLRSIPTLRSALHGVNAAVVGLLFAALIKPLAATALHSPVDLAVAVACFTLLTLRRVPPWLIVLVTATAYALL